MSLDNYISEVKARAEKATKGEWLVDYDWRRDGSHQIIHFKHGSRTICFMSTGHIRETPDPDAEFFAHSRADIDTLLAIVERQQQALEEIVNGETCDKFTCEASCEGCGEDCNEHIAKQALADVEEMVRKK